MSATRTVEVGGQPGYAVHVGPGVLDRLAEHVRPGRRVLVVAQPGREVVVADAVEALGSAGARVLTTTVPDAEAAKTAEVLTGLWALLGREGFTRDDLVVGVGGGAVTDLAGFVAATWLRGVDSVMLPTSMLGVVDAAVGGKTGINTGEGKNLVGAFHPPRAVLCDPAWLRTMSRADYVSGLAEVVKCGFIADPVILELVEADPERAADPAADPELAVELVARAVQVKADVVAADLREASLREILNYGHTFGHAVELIEGYTWRHGDAVSVGMVFVAELAHRAGLVDGDLLARHRSVLGALGLPTAYPGGADRWADLRAAMGRDKKSRGDTLRFVVLEGLARPTRLVGPDEELLRSAHAAVS
ncbi:3-dehydroquinate synthase [Ornithinimicrobium tianjinense]|uniref:3-dehydroquinate synthase n=1 Tax=Ornithinimicrobium tianjinense TaxID=1195761 RepID=A0A917BL56_9MICO|nr:3-dehydroquinate synthase [Ornithinimicrobium tianjinense]GGF48527.1 3-dehydroquinate synthase [Ornithinimicrobium tianjinense]